MGFICSHTTRLSRLMCCCLFLLGLWCLWWAEVWCRLRAERSNKGMNNFKQSTNVYVHGDSFSFNNDGYKKVCSPSCKMCSRMLSWVRFEAIPGVGSKNWEGLCVTVVWMKSLLGEVLVILLMTWAQCLKHQDFTISQPCSSRNQPFPRRLLLTFNFTIYEQRKLTLQTKHSKS